MRRTLLIANGDSPLCEDYQRILNERGYDVETASDGLDCLEKLRQATPDVLLLEWELPWGGGAGVLADLREDRSMESLPVVLIANVIDPQQMAEFIESPVIDFLHKPFSLTKLLASLQAAIAIKKHRKPSPPSRVLA